MDAPRRVGQLASLFLRLYPALRSRRRMRTCSSRLLTPGRTLRPSFPCRRGQMKKATRQGCSHDASKAKPAENTYFSLELVRSRDDVSLEGSDERFPVGAGSVQQRSRNRQDRRRPSDRENDGPFVLRDLRNDPGECHMGLNTMAR